MLLVGVAGSLESWTTPHVIWARSSVSVSVLHKFGELSAVDDPDLRRKAGGVARRLTDSERKWIDEAMRRIALQVAELAAGGDPSQLTMNDLPPG